MSEPTQRREIDLHRRVCVIKPDTIDIRPARSAAVVPLLGFLLGVFAFVAVLLWIEQIPFLLVLLLMGSAILLVPFAGMGFVYSVYGANVVIDRKKQTAVWQQGLLGMGVGTQELVPFYKMERLEVEDMSREGHEEGHPQDVAQFEIRLLKASGRRLSLGQVTVPRYLAAEGLARAREVGEAVAALVEKPLEMVGGEPRRPRRRRRRRAPARV
ncbi:MAG: hypothetical protein A2148_11270 [Chloroflexi bacterium RBG_16_68_14]|nr:MAG: hypothetical protein A2148_11270 [Chloroflexi bacterium RBG_16_68_14]